MKTPILGSAYVARSINEADNQMINLYPEIVPEGGKESAFLIKTPGLRLLATVGTGPIRGLWWHANYAYVVSGSSFYKVNTAYNATLIGTIEGTGLVSMVDNGGVIFIAAGAHSYQYNINTSELLEITDADFLGAAVVGYLDTYFVYITPNSQLVSTVSSITPTGDFIWPLVFDATSVGSAEGAPDNLVSMVIDHNEVWLLGENSTEVWYDAGNADFPLQRIQGAFNELGCAARFSVAKMDNTIFWLGADARGRGIVYKANGYRGERVSTHAIEFAISQYGDLSNAIAYTYQQEGHSFYVLTFPNVGVTWAYDAATNAWHQRGEWLSANYGRHRGNCQLAFNNENIVGDYINGNLYALDLDVFDDNGTPIRWLRSWRALPTGSNNLKRTAHHSLQLDCESGVGVAGIDQYSDPALLTTDYSYVESIFSSTDSVDLTKIYVNGIAVWNEIDVGFFVRGDYIIEGTTVLSKGSDIFYGWYVMLSAAATAKIDSQPTYYAASFDDEEFVITEDGFYIAMDEAYTQGVTPQVMLRWSDDGGHTWSNEHWASMGKLGEYYKRVIWRRLGMTTKIRDRVYEVSGSDPVSVYIMGAELVISGTNA